MAPDAAEAAAQTKRGYKRLIVCCDGTWNDSISTDSPLTNVARISRCIPGVSDSGVLQLVSYFSGVGSGTSKGGNIVDGMIGRGISAHIRDAYTFLCHNYWRDEDSKDNSDEIVLIGFSRGAFTVRSIASFIADVGLLEKAGLSYMLKLYRLWANQVSKKRKKDATFPSIPPTTPGIRMRRLCRMLEEMKLLRTSVKIKACAVWDTVGSLGFPMPGPIPQRASKKLAFVNSTLVDHIQVAIQALALNERRKHFLPTVWKPNSKTQLRQCWFLGAHSDVGGGYEDTGLANLALVWMIAQLSDILYFDRGALHHLASHRPIGNIEKRITKAREFSVNVSIGVIGAGFDASRGSTTTTTLRKRAGQIQNSVKGPFLFAGTKSRKPGQYLMSSSGLYRASKVMPVSTNETIHWTVRVLLGTGLRECPALGKYSTVSEDGTSVLWALHTKRGTDTAIRLREDEFSVLEQDLLISWMEAEGHQQDGGTDAGVGGLQAVAASVQPSTTSDVKMSLASILIPLLNEPQQPTIHFPPSPQGLSILLGAEHAAETEVVPGKICTDTIGSNPQAST